MIDEDGVELQGHEWCFPSTDPLCHQRRKITTSSIMYASVFVGWSEIPMAPSPPPPPPPSSSSSAAAAGAAPTAAAPAAASS